MNLKKRIKLLENKMIAQQPKWAVFTIGYYEDPIRRKEAMQRILDKHHINGRQADSYIFINEIPSPSYNGIHEEKFVCSF